MARLEKCASTSMMSFSVYKAAAQSIRKVSVHHGSLGRAFQVAVEILYDRARKGEPLVGSHFDDDDPNLGLKVPFSFSVTPRTQILVDLLCTPEPPDSNSATERKGRNGFQFDLGINARNSGFVPDFVRAPNCRPSCDGANYRARPIWALTPSSFFE